MEKTTTRSLSNLVRENPDKPILGRFTTFGGPYRSGGYYDIEVRVNDQTYRDNVYSYARDIILSMSLITERLVFKAENFEAEDGPLPLIYGHGHLDYSDEEFFRVNGCERKDVAHVIGFADGMDNETSRELVGDVIVYPRFANYRGELDGLIEELERNLFGISMREVNEIYGLDITGSQKFDDMKKISIEDLMKRYRL